MPAQSTLTTDEKSRLKAAIVPTGKIHTAALARIYFAHPDPNSWSYGGLQGALAFVMDNNKNAFFLRMVDLVGTRGVIWEHELYEGFEYFQDRPFFHSFPGDVRCGFYIIRSVHSAHATTEMHDWPRLRGRE